MKFVKIKPSNLIGSISAPPSKSFTHRAIICAALSGQKCKISPIAFSKDIIATINAMKSMGFKITCFKDSLEVCGYDNLKKEIIIDAMDSASTLRFLIPVVSLLGIKTIFKRSESLSKRPISIFLKEISNLGVKCEILNDLSIKVSGMLKCGKIFVSGNVSSQFISGLLMTLPLLKGNSEIIITSNLESSGYIDITLEVMKKFGIKISKTSSGFFIPGFQKYKSIYYNIEGDWSQAAFFLVGGAISGDITLKNLNFNSVQPDIKILDILLKFGANIKFDVNKYLNIKKSNLYACEISVSQIPDLVPIIAVLASFAKGKTKIKNAKRLKYKECDRLKAIFEEIKKIGVNAKIYNDSLEIIGSNKKIIGGKVENYNDHRIEMALSIMGSNVLESLTIYNFGSFEKSYPNFFEDYKSVGGNFNVINLGK